MSIEKMDSEDDLLIAMVGVAAILTLIAYRKRRRIRQYWVNPFLRSRQQTGRFSTAVSFCNSFDVQNEILIVNDNSFRIWLNFRKHLMKTSIWTTKILNYFILKSKNISNQNETHELMLYHRNSV